MNNSSIDILNWMLSNGVKQKLLIIHITDFTEKLHDKVECRFMAALSNVKQLCCYLQKSVNIYPLDLIGASTKLNDFTLHSDKFDTITNDKLQSTIDGIVQKSSRSHLICDANYNGGFNMYAFDQWMAKTKDSNSQFFNSIHFKIENRTVVKNSNSCDPWDGFFYDHIDGNHEHNYEFINQGFECLCDARNHLERDVRDQMKMVTWLLSYKKDPKWKTIGVQNISMYFKHEHNYHIISKKEPWTYFEDFVGPTMEELYEQGQLLQSQFNSRINKASKEIVDTYVSNELQQLSKDNNIDFSYENNCESFIFEC
eukprot:67143_1